MTGAALVFDRYHHRYSAAGVAVPSVSEILAPLYNFEQVPLHVLRAAAAFGTAVHRACELDDLGQLDEGTLDPQLAGHLHAWRSFCNGHQVRWTLVEARLHHQQMAYAGTVDRYGQVGGSDAVVDLKTTVKLYPAVGPQLAAYAKAIAGTTPATRRLAVQLKASGHYVVKEYTSGADWAVFASLLTLRSFCQQHGITPNYKEPR